MQQQHLYEYAVIRIMPRVEREEFLNAGVILYCAKQHFLQARFEVNQDRLKSFCSGIDCEEIQRNLSALQRICNRDKTGGPIACLDDAGRFRWLTATRSTVIQSSKVHPGFCEDPLQTLNRLYESLVV